MPDPIAITGAPGNVGTPLSRALLSRGQRVRVLARRPEHARAVLGEHPNLEIVRFEYGDRLTYVPAFAGVKKLFVVRPTNLTAVEKLMFPALDVALGAGVQQFVLLSILGAEKLPLLPHARLERHLHGNGAAFTSLRPGYFLQNFTTSHAPELKHGELFAAAGGARASFIDARDIAEAAAIVLTQDGHNGQYYDLTGAQSLTFAEAAQIFSRVLGRPVKYTSADPITFFRRWSGRGMPLQKIMGWEAIYAATRVGLIAKMTPNLSHLLGRAPRTVADFARDELKGLMEK